MTATITAAVGAAIDAALTARLPTIIDAIKQALPTKNSASDYSVSDRFIPMREVEKLLGCHRSTVKRRADADVYPPIRKQGTSAGYYASDLEKIMAKPEQVAPAKRAQELRGRP
jgi:predicted DNA-binding transcriptional regulator AlpA